MRTDALVTGGREHLQGRGDTGLRAEAQYCGEAGLTKDSRVRELRLGLMGKGKRVARRQDSLAGRRAPLPAPDSRTPAPPSLRLGRGDRRRRRRGRAPTGRAGIARCAQALRGPLLRPPPLRGRQIRARRRAPKVRSTPARLHGHRLRRGAVTASASSRLGPAPINRRPPTTSPPPPLCAGSAAGVGRLGEGLPTVPESPRLQAWRVVVERGFPLAKKARARRVEGSFRVGLPACLGVA